MNANIEPAIAGRTGGTGTPGLSLSPTDILAVAIGVPVAAAAAARLALRRVHISPLGVVRRTTQKPPPRRRPAGRLPCHQRLVLALFITTAAVVALTARDTKEQTRFGSAAAAPVVTDQLAVSPKFASPVQGEPITGSGPAAPAAPAAPLAAQLHGIPASKAWS